MPAEIASHVVLGGDDRLEGWVINTRAPRRPTRIQISVDGQVMATLLCGDLIDRRLLEAGEVRLPEDAAARLEGVTLVPAAFSYRIPTSIARGAPHRIEVAALVRGEMSPIFAAETTLADRTIAALKHFFRDFRFIELENVARLEGERVRFGGWASLPEPSGEGIGVAVNGRAVEGVAVERLAASPDPNHFTFWPDRPAYAVRGEVDLGAIAVSERGYRFNGIDAATGARAFPAAQDFYLPPYWRECLETWPVAPVGGIGRTTPKTARRAEREGDDFVRTGFLFSGYQDLWHIEDAVHRHAGRRIGEMRRVLDWGCGCGRLTQHLPRIEGCEAHGADIDPDNIAWASANIPGATFTRIALDPPTPYPDDTFDMVVGISVFTHLTEADQFAWLEELRRILKPGGLLAVTVAGNNALKRAGLRNVIRFHQATEERGFSDDSIGNLFNWLLKERPTYYRNTRHLPHYVEREWGRTFDIKGIEFGAMSGQQDMVVGVKR